MRSLPIFYSSIWSQISDTLAAPSFQWILLIGCGLLAVSLLVLILTRWGQARPIWKCVVLSVVAHLLLIGYLYGTQLISRAPRLQRNAVVSMKVIDPDVEPQPEVEPPAIQEQEPEEQFAETDFVPDLEPLVRPDLDSQVEIKEAVAEQLGKAFENAALAAEQSPFRAEPAQMKPNDFQATPVKHESAAPEEIEFQRRSEPETDPPNVPAMLEENGDFEVPRVQAEDDLPEVTPPEIEVPKAPSVDSPPIAPEINEESFEPQVTQKRPDAELASEEVKHSPKSEMIPVSRMRRPSDDAPMPKLYSLRTENRTEIAKVRGGSEASERAVDDALAWLARSQSQDGRWDSDFHGGGVETRALGHNRDHAGVNADTGVTALALLALMAGGNTHFEGEYRENVQYGLEFLLRSQRADGQLAGQAKLFARMYCHSMALLALSEALAVTGDERLKQAVRKGIEYTVRSQNSQDGGWRYQPGDAGDMSQFGWKVLALHSASLGGVHAPEKTINRMRQFLDQCTSGPAKGLGAYRPGDRASSPMTAEALVCRYFLHGDVSEQTIDEAVKKITQQMPNDREINLYYWYYGTMAMYHTGGSAWKDWNDALHGVLVSRQVTQGPNQGSWDPDGVWGGYGGRVYSTALAALCLEVYYRHLPIYEARKR